MSQQQPSNGVFTFNAGGRGIGENADEKEKRLLEDLKKFVASHPQIIGAGWSAHSTGQVKLK